MKVKLHLILTHVQVQVMLRVFCITVYLKLNKNFSSCFQFQNTRPSQQMIEHKEQQQRGYTESQRVHPHEVHVYRQPSQRQISTKAKSVRIIIGERFRSTVMASNDICNFHLRLKKSAWKLQLERLMKCTSLPRSEHARPRNLEIEIYYDNVKNF